MDIPRLLPHLRVPVKTQWKQLHFEMQKAYIYCGADYFFGPRRKEFPPTQQDALELLYTYCAGHEL